MQVKIYKQLAVGGLRAGFFLWVFCTAWGFGSAQNIERKIIIQNNNFYYTTIDPEFQLATLDVGRISEPLNKARHFALPAGRSLNEPVNPFSWDIYHGVIYVVNFLDHPRNDKNRALERFLLSSLHEWNSPNKDSIANMLMKSLQGEPFAMNDPYLFTIRRSPVLNNFFFDAIAVNDTSYYMAIANNGEFCVWNYNGHEWKQGKIQRLLTEGYFTLFLEKGNLYMLSDQGKISELSMNQVLSVKNISVKGALKDMVLIVNKEDKSIRYIPNSELKKNLELKSLIATKSTSIF